MGGHGGLNILPQKRWNVYNRDNRLKVAQDEAKQKQAEEEAQRRHAKAESEHRHSLLLQRARARSGPSLHEQQGGADWSAAEVAALPQPKTERHETRHINFFAEEEAAAAHPDVEKEQADEKRRRGNPEFYTSDARFDERFQLGFGMGKEQPWYARRLQSAPLQQSQPTPNHLTGTIQGPTTNGWALPPSQCTDQPRQSKLAPHVGEEDKSQKDEHVKKRRASHERRDRHGAKKKKKSGKRARKRRRDDSDTEEDDSRSSSSSDSSSSSSSGSSSSSSEDDSGSSRSLSARKRSSKRSKDSRQSKTPHKKQKKSKHAKKEVVVSHAGSMAKSGMKTIEQLRLERLRREEQERSKAREVLFGSLDGQPRSVSGHHKQYHSGYGNAPPKRTQRG